MSIGIEFMVRNIELATWLASGTPDSETWLNELWSQVLSVGDDAAWGRRGRSYLLANAVAWHRYGKMAQGVSNRSFNAYEREWRCAALDPHEPCKWTFFLTLLLLLSKNETDQNRVYRIWRAERHILGNWKRPSRSSFLQTAKQPRFPQKIDKGRIESE